MPRNPNYIPSADADFNNWALNFSAKLTASPVLYGLVAADALAVAASVLIWSPAYAAATTPATKTSVTVAAKSAARASLEELARPLAVRVSINRAVTPANKIALGVTARNTVRTPVPTPAQGPELAFISATPGRINFRYSNPEAPDSKAVPLGCAGVETFVTWTDGAPGLFENATYVGRSTKSPLSINTVGRTGQTATIWCRYVTAQGNEGVARVSPVGQPIVSVCV